LNALSYKTSMIFFLLLNVFSSVELLEDANWPFRIMADSYIMSILHSFLGHKS